MDDLKYYLKKPNQEIHGPYTVAFIFSLVVKGEFSEDSVLSENFSGPWLRLDEIEYLQDRFNNLFESYQNENQEKDLTNLEETVVRLNLAKKNQNFKETIQKEQELKKVKEDIDKKELEIEISGESEDSQSKEASYREFKFDKTEKIEIDYDELEKKYKEEKVEDDDEEDLEQKKSLEKTVVKKIQPALETDKTKIVKRDDLLEKPPQEKTEIKSPSETQEKQEKEQQVPIELDREETIVDSSEATTFFDLDEVKDDLEDEAFDLEQQIIEEEEDEKNQFNEFQEHKDEISEEEEEPKEKRKIRPITAFAFIVVFYFLLFDDDDTSQKQLTPILAQVNGPVVNAKVDIKKAQDYFRLGVENYIKGDYISKIKAAEAFKRSVENKYRNNPALSWLILVYGELLPESKDKRKAQKTVFNLIKQTRSKMLTDVNVALGSAYFYHYYGKGASAFKILENFLNLESPNKKLVSLYLDLALEQGDFVTAQKVVERLEKTPDKPVESYISLSRYYKLDQRLGEAKALLREALKLYGNNSRLLLEYNEYQLQDRNYKDFLETLKRVEQMGAGRRPTVYARYLEQMGILSVLNKDNKKASVFFKLALKLHESNSLRSKLAALEVGGDKLTKDLIIESKVIELVKKSKKLLKETEWDEALSVAVEASDLNPHYVPAQIHLAKIQAQRGYFGLAISTLEKAQKKNTKDPLVNFALVDAYLQADKHKEARDLINIISNNNIRKHPLYSSTMGHYFFHIKNYSMANKHLSRSIVLNPLRDEDYFLMAKMFLMSRQYKEAKIRLNEAIILDPLNIEYKIMLSEIIYELDGTQAAIGYLRKNLESYVDNPKLMGQIAKFYYKSGEIKQFEFYKEKIRKLSNRDGDFYRFLFDSAMLEEKKELALDYGLQLLNIEPGDVKTRLAVAEVYKSLGQYNEALEMYDSILKRLSTYPTVHYEKSKILMLQGKLEQATEEAEKEIKLNPSLYHGHFAKGEVLRLKENYDEAVKYFEKAISLEPSSVEALKSLGWIKLRQRHYNLAKELYLRAKKSAESDPDIRKQLCLIYEGVGQSRLAIEECQLYLKLYPNAPDRTTIEKLINVLR